MPGVIRPRKNGGYSLCYSPDELVGKGRCCHILCSNGESPLEIVKIQRGIYQVEVGDSHLTIEAQKEAVIDFFSKIPKLEDNETDKILKFLNNEEGVENE